MIHRARVGLKPLVMWLWPRITMDTFISITRLIFFIIWKDKCLLKLYIVWPRRTPDARVDGRDLILHNQGLNSNKVRIKKWQSSMDIFTSAQTYFTRYPFNIHCVFSDISCYCCNTLYYTWYNLFYIIQFAHYTTLFPNTSCSFTILDHSGLTTKTFFFPNISCI